MENQFCHLTCVPVLTWKTYPDLLSVAPALCYIATMAKHGPFKVKLGLRWAEVYDAHAVESTTMDSTESFTHMMSKKYMLSLTSLKGVLHLREADLDCMIQLLQIVAHDVMDVDFRYWNQNVGRGYSIYSGPMLFLKRFLGLIVGGVELWDVGLCPMPAVRLPSLP